MERDPAALSEERGERLNGIIIRQGSQAVEAGRRDFLGEVKSF